MSDFYQDLVTQTALNNAFNASQADINRDWQEYMSGTSHQREVQDLIAAGLNPVLSANSGSTWQSVGNATADAGAANLAATWLNNQASLEMSKISAQAQVAAASSAASIAAAATRYAAETSAEAAKYSAPASVKVSAGPVDFSVSGPSGEVGDFINAAGYGYGSAAAYNSYY